MLLNFSKNSASDVVYVLLIAHNHHHTETNLTFNIFVSMSWPSSIYVVLCDPFFIFSLIFIIINYIISSKQAQLFLAHFLEYLMLVLDGNMDEESE